MSADTLQTESDGKPQMDESTLQEVSTLDSTAQVPSGRAAATARSSAKRAGRRRSAGAAATSTTQARRAEEAVVVEALAKEVGLDEGQVIVRIAKNYDGGWSRKGNDYKVTGEIHNIQWRRYQPVVQGVQTIVERVLGLSPGKLSAQSELLASTTYLRASFVIAIPKSMTANQKDQFNVAVSAFNQRLIDQEKKIVEDLLQEQEPAMVQLGIEAAEQVRRIAPGLSLPAGAEVVNGIDGKPAALSQKIGRYPDQEVDGADQTLEGSVAAVDKDLNRIVVRGEVRAEAAEMPAGKAGKAKSSGKRKSSRGRRIAIQYDPKRYDAEHFTKFMLASASVEVRASVKTRVGKEFLTIADIKPSKPDA